MENEIEINKQKIKDYEFEISAQESEIKTLGLDLERVRFEYHSLMSESRMLFDKLSNSKKDYIFELSDLINNPEANRTKMLRKNIVKISSYHVDKDETGEFEELSKKIWSKRGKYKKLFLFEVDDFPETNKTIEISKNRKIWPFEILDFAGLENYYESSPYLIIKDKDRTKQTVGTLIEIPDEEDMIAIECANLDSYELMCKTDDKESQKIYLDEFIKGVRNEIDRISKVNYINTNYEDNDSIGKVLFYFPIEESLKKTLSQDPELLQYALDKDIEIVFPTTLLGIINHISNGLRTKGINELFKKYESLREQFIERQKKEVNENKSKISQLLKINFEYLKSPSYQVKVTLNHEENYVLEDLVKAKGSNKSSVLRQILMEYNDIYRERDALKLSVEKINLEKNFLQEECIRDLRELKIKHEFMQKDLETELKRELLEVRHQRDALVNKHRSDIENLQNELMRKTEHYQSESKALKDDFDRREEFMYKAIKSIEESISNNKKTLEEDVIKNAVQVINPKNINEFGKIMELINQNILILCDTSSIANKDQQRFIDMVYGGVYGLKGKIKEVSNKIFLYIPKNFDLIDDSEIS